MNRKIVYAGAAWTSGLALAAVSGSVPAALAAAFSSVLILRLLLRFDIKRIILLAVSFIAAFGFYKAYDITVYRHITGFAGKEIQYTGAVTDFKDMSDDKSLYYLSGKINGKTKAELILYTDSLMCEAGDRISFICTPELPENEYLFNSLDYYRSKGIYLRTDTAGNINISPSRFSLRKTLSKFRAEVCSVIENSVPAEEAGMIKGMLFGDKSGIDEDNKTMLYRTGIGHVTAVSGLHLVLFCTIISFILKKLRIGKTAEFALSEFFMLLFMICCGMSLSVIRAFIMVTLANLAPLFFRYSDCLNSVCIAVILITLSDPFVIENSSFLLSVSGALGAGVFAPYMTSNMRSDSPVRKHLKNLAFTICISLAVMPASVICFGEISLVSPLSNLIIVPLCMAAVFIAVIASLIIFVHPVFLFKISGALCRIVLNISGIIGRNRITHVNITGKHIPVITFMLFIFCVMSYLIFRSRKYSLLSAVISIAVLFNSSALYNISESRILKIALLGKNEPGVIIISKGSAADIIDLNGKAKNSRYTAKYLNDSGITKINSIVIAGSPYAAMSSYNYELSLFEVENVILPSDTYIRKDTLICGCMPEYSDFTEWSADYGRYSVTFKDNRICTDYGDFHFSSDNADYPANTVMYAYNSGKCNLRRLGNG